MQTITLRRSSRAQEREKEKLGEGNVAWRKFLTQTQHEAALHFQNDVGKPFRIRTNLIGRISCERDGSPRIQRALKLKALCGLSTSPRQEFG